MNDATATLPAAEILASPQGVAVLIPDGLDQPARFRLSNDAFTVLAANLSPIAQLTLSPEQRTRLAHLGVISCVAVDEKGPTKNWFLRRTR